MILRVEKNPLSQSSGEMNSWKGSLAENVLEKGIIFEERELRVSARHGGEECVRGDPGAGPTLLREKMPTVRLLSPGVWCRRFSSMGSSFTETLMYVTGITHST